MNTLAIDTTGSLLTVVLLTADGEFSRVIDAGKSGHSSILIPTVDAVMKEGGISASDLDAVAAVVGPGSFTGIRIGVAAATAMSYDGAKRIAVNSFELLAYNRGQATVAVDAGHGNLYIAECLNGKILSTDFVAEDEKDKLKGVKLITSLSMSPAATLSAVVKNKLANAEYIGVLEPVYMRKSQAERNLK